MKKTNAFIAAALAASMLTACGGTDTAEVTSAESTVSETTAATVSETDTMSAKNEETTTETSIESVESVSDTEAVEEAENTHWDTIVYDTTLKTDVTDWEFEAENFVRTGMFCTMVEALRLSDIPDVVMSYLYENSSTYKMCFDNDNAIQGITSGVKDFDSDGVEETFYAINYLLYDEGWTSSIGDMGAFPSDIVIYDAAEGVLYPCDNLEVTNVGCYFASDPAAKSESLDTRRYEWYYACDESMYFTEDNIFISCNLGEVDYYGYVKAYNRYNRLVYENGEYSIESVGTAGWRLNVPPSDVEYTETHAEIVRIAYVGVEKATGENTTLGMFRYYTDENGEPWWNSETTYYIDYGFAVSGDDVLQYFPAGTAVPSTIVLFPECGDFYYYGAATQEEYENNECHWTKSQDMYLTWSPDSDSTTVGNFYYYKGSDKKPVFYENGVWRCGSENIWIDPMDYLMG